jgi:hypothetical protein
LRGLTIIAGSAKSDGWLKILLYAGWLAVMLGIASQHVFWRDEVRALSLALAGNNVVEMLRAIHGEGHPAIWYLMLRGAHAIVPVREVLPVVAWLVAAAAMAVLVFRSPFRPWLLALILFSRFGLLEYAVIARNYGIAMLLLFMLAWLYPRWRDRGPAIGLVLALICNTYVPAALLSAAFLLFWLIELIGEEGLKWGPKYRLFLLNSAIAALGALLAFVTVFPTVHDAAQNPLPDGIGIGLILESLAAPALAFGDMIPMVVPDSALVSSLFGLVMFAALLGLARRPAALLSTMAAMGALQLFFNIVYPSYYRHQALFLVYLIVMYWLVAVGRGGRWPSPRSEDEGLDSLRIGSLALVALLALQVMSCITLAGFELTRYPFSRSRDLAELIEREHLTRAVILSNPDYMAEALPYYLPNPIYLMRERKYGHVVRFSAHVRRELSLDDFIREGHEIQRRTGRPVVIMLEKRLGPHTKAFRILDVHVWHFNGTPEQVGRFLASTRRLARFGDAITQETYDVYLLNPPTKPSA